MTRYKRIILCSSITIFISLIDVLWGIFFLNPGDEMGYSVLNYYLIFPLTALIIGGALGIRKTYLQWFYILLVGVLGLLIPLLVFGNTSLDLAIIGMCSALLGISAGMLIHFLRLRRQE